MTTWKNFVNLFLCSLIILLLASITQASSSGEFLAQKDRDRIGMQLSDLNGRVSMVMFTQELECQYCTQTRGLLEELANMSDKLTLTVFDFVHDPGEVQKYGIDKIPATVLMADEDVGIRYYGVPAGYELTALVETIKDLSAGTTKLGPELVDKLADITEAVHIQVFVTPTCPYCPGAVRTAYHLARAHPRIHADGIEVVEFPYLATRYHVRGVPMVVVNEHTSFVGAQSEVYFVEKILQAIQKSASQRKENE